MGEEEDAERKDGKDHPHPSVSVIEHKQLLRLLPLLIYS